MKSYVKPTLEVISMKTSENIADNIIKTLYTRTSETSGFTLNATGGTYNEELDIIGSQNLE